MKVCVIGIGRVGLPLSLMLDSVGHEVFVYDINPAAVQCFENGVMPFAEPGMEELLDVCEITVVDKIPKCEAYVVTAGTPVIQHFLPDTNVIDQIVDDLFSAGLMQGSLLILRSTVPVGYTMNVAERVLADYNMVLGMDYFLAYCPERIAEGQALAELRKHPQLVGTEAVFDPSFIGAQGVFHWTNCLPMLFNEAEFAKLATNTYRAMHFAIASYLQMVSEKHGVDFSALRPKMMSAYPRLKDLPSPGFTAGTCLRKDFAMLAEPGDLAYQSYLTNENYPRWVAEQVGFPGATILILGAGFKDNSDDLRDSLVDVLYGSLRRVCGRYPTVCDLNLEPWHEYKFTSGEIFYNTELDHAVDAAVYYDAVIFGNPQSASIDEILKSGILEKAGIIVNPFGSNGFVTYDRETH